VKNFLGKSQEANHLIISSIFDFSWKERKVDFMSNGSSDDNIELVSLDPSTIKLTLFPLADLSRRFCQLLTFHVAM